MNSDIPKSQLQINEKGKYGHNLLKTFNIIEGRQSCQYKNPKRFCDWCDLSSEVSSAKSQ